MKRILYIVTTVAALMVGCAIGSTIPDQISGSVHAQDAEKPKPPTKPTRYVQSRQSIEAARKAEAITYKCELLEPNWTTSREEKPSDLARQLNRHGAHGWYLAAVFGETLCFAKHGQ